jgi:hypothetical protein
VGASEVDPVDAEPPQAAIDGDAEVLGPAVHPVLAPAGSIAIPTSVATTTWSRIGAIAAPRSASSWNGPYASARGGRALKRWLIPMHPRPRAETVPPDMPTLRVSTLSSCDEPSDCRHTI